MKKEDISSHYVSNAVPFILAEFVEVDIQERNGDDEVTEDMGSCFTACPEYGECDE